ncbi:MAG: glucan biosynthesis protein G [Gemmatimonadetes bacterium]|nr:glucan biosynthesis protein G [Gemmatimonadota bacterium]
MASIRLQIALTCTLALGALVACSGEDVRAPRPESSSPGESHTVAPWAADANGGTLFDHVAEEARRRASSPYRAPDHALVAAAADLDYAAYRDIRFRDERAIWHGAAPFEVQLFHPGGGSDVPVRIHLVEDGASRPLDFDGSLFDYGELAQGALETSPSGPPPEVGYAGFRVLATMNEPTKMDEVAAFLGASYFRLVGPSHVYGLSSRGLAVDIAESGGEEFPDFVGFWLVRPEADADALTFYGLLDSPSVAGAYRFDLRPGTSLDVSARLFFREDVAKVGIAPLTSMYLHSPTIPGGHDDFRPRVHDSEGLAMLTSKGEWVWRPLTNGRGVRVTSLRDVDPAGFGLVQRTRDFDEYLDLEARYHRRPSVWVDIDESWGGGGVELLEIPTTSEFNDNVVAYWVPDGDPVAGDTLSVRYRLVTFDSALGSTDGLPVRRVAAVARTSIGWDALPGEAEPPPRSRRRVVVDFEGGGLPSLSPSETVTASLSVSSGTTTDVRVEVLPNGGRRATFSLEPDGERGADMRLFLVHTDTVVSETWSYLWDPSLVR